MTKAIVCRATGGIDVLKLEDVSVGEPAAGQIKLRQTIAGVNFIDTYHRSGLYAVPMPLTPGLEGVGIVESLGTDVVDLKVGDRVFTAMGPLAAMHKRGSFQRPAWLKCQRN